MTPRVYKLHLEARDHSRNQGFEIGTKTHETCSTLVRASITIPSPSMAGLQ